MIENSIYFGKQDFYNLINNIGGTWNDSKERPIMCLFKLSENDKIYWAIPLGNWNHRDEVAKNRIKRYLGYDDSDIRSCFYHVGNTDVKSIFFITDVVPITDKYIERSYLSKLKRVLAWENAKPNYYRQHITDIKNYLIKEIEEEA